MLGVVEGGRVRDMGGGVSHQNIFEHVWGNVRTVFKTYTGMTKIMKIYLFACLISVTNKDCSTKYFAQINV